MTINQKCIGRSVENNTKLKAKISSKINKFDHNTKLKAVTNSEDLAASALIYTDFVAKIFEINLRRVNMLIIPEKL